MEAALRRKCASGERMEMKRQKVGSKDVDETTPLRRGKLADAEEGKLNLQAERLFI